MVEVGVHRVGPPPEVQVVWKVEAILIHVVFCHLKRKKRNSTCISQVSLAQHVRNCDNGCKECRAVARYEDVKV